VLGILGTLYSGFWIWGIAGISHMSF
jgi:hypothetical protein